MSKKILIIDDEPQIVKSTAKCLELSGYEVFTTTDGVSGINQFKQDPPDLVILDIIMTGLSGLDTLKELKQIKPDVPVIMLTGYGTMDSALECIKLGAYDHIAKPFDLKELLALIKEALKK